MNRLLTLGRWLGDRVNPIAVKEFRQAVQSRWVSGILMLFLVVNLTILGGYLILSPDADTNISAGRSIFGVLYVILTITCIGFVPLYTGIRMSLERSDMNTDLLFITTITPGTIVRGKYLTAMALTLLMFSACMPFMILTFLLRGIDLPTIFLILGIAYLACALANALGIFAGSVAGSWLIRGLVDIGVLLSLFYLIGGTIALAEGLTMIGISAAFYSWSYLSGWIAVELLAIGLLYVFAVAMLSPKPSNRMFVPRLYITAVWIITGVTTGFFTLLYGSTMTVASWVMPCAVACMVLLAVTMGERDAWSARVRRTIPRSSVLRGLAFLFYSGSAGGVLWTVLLFAATMFVGFQLDARCWVTGTSHGMMELYKNTMLVFGYFLCYCLTIASLRPTVFRKVATPSLSVFAAFLGVLLFLGPYIIAFTMERRWWDSPPWYMYASPVVLTTTKYDTHAISATFVIVWLVVTSLLSIGWWGGQWRRFVPYDDGLQPSDLVRSIGTEPALD